MGLIVFLLCSLFAANHLLAQDLEGFEDRRQVWAIRLSDEESISLDGRLDEDIWQRAEAAADFVTGRALQRRPCYGAYRGAHRLRQ